MTRKVGYFFFFLLFLGGGCFIFFHPYHKVKQQAIAAADAEQEIIARQAALGIEEFFHYYGRILDYLANSDQIIRMSEAGIDMLADFYRHHHLEISAITRINAEGKILFTIPYNENFIGRDVSHQPHNREIIQRHQPLVSDVFSAVQGYQTVAYAMPMFKGQSYDGCLTILISFEILARRHLEEVRQGPGGHAWMISKQGTNLYCPQNSPAICEQPAEDKIDPALLAIKKRMMAGTRGYGSYQCRSALSGDEIIRKHVAFQPVYLPNNYWALAISVPEKQILASLNEFRLRWMLLFSIFTVLLIFFSLRLFRAQALVAEVERRRRSETKLARNEKFLMRVFNEAPAPMVVFDFSGKLIIINQSCRELLGYSTKDLENLEQWFDLAYQQAPQERLAAEKIWGKLQQAPLAETSNKTYSYETEVAAKNGKLLSLDIRLNRIEDRFIVAIDDKTPAQQLERERQALNREKIRAGKMETLGLLAGSVAHDLNNILSGIINIPELILLRYQLEPELKSRIETIKKTGERAAAAVTDLLTMARGAAANREILDLNKVVKEQLASVEHLDLVNREPGITFEPCLHSLPIPVESASNQLRKVLMNLIFNAAEAVSPQGRITISTEIRSMAMEHNGFEKIPAGNYAIIIVKDNGTGIEPQKIEHIFEPFYSTKVLGRSGTGLGLTVVWNCVHDHNGFIDLTTGREGTTFTIFFPLSRSRIELSPEKKEEVDQYRGQQETILVVDDDPNQRLITRELLNHLNYRAVCQDGGEAALAWLEDNETDLIIIDMIMTPGISGRELYEKLRQRQLNPATLIVSGYAANQDVRIIQEQGAGPFIKKPFSLAQLGAAVQSALQNRSTG